MNSVSNLNSSDQIKQPKLDLRERVDQIEDLPSIPDMALQLLELRDDPDATVEQLVGIIELDPAMSAQVIRYANSPLYGQNGIVDTLQDAIFRVLGFETVLYIALGGALSKAFQLPIDGPFGLKAFWSNAVFSAALAQRVANLHGRELNVKPGTAYLCGLLHNIGYLVLATLFESEYFWLNKVTTAKPEFPVTAMEYQLLGTSHTELAQLLMKSWGLPAEIITVAKEHHNIEYDGEFAQTVHLIQVCDQLLRSHNLSDADSGEISLELCNKLKLDDSELYLAMDDVLESSDVLESMIKIFSNG